MSIMKVTLLGIESYLHDNNKSLFDNVVFPEGINKEDTVNNILLQGGEFEPLYAEPYFLQSAITHWSRKHYRTFQKWIDALNIEYAPLDNYDRDESWWDHSKTDNDNTRTLDHQDKRTLDTEVKLTLDTENKRTLDTQDQETRDISDETVYDKTTTTENEVSAFDSSSYQPSTKSTVDEDGTVTVNGTGTDTFNHTGTDTVDNSGTETTDNTGTDTVDYSGTIKDENDVTVQSSHGGRIHGNIGVTTSQQMLQAELDISRWNIIEQITDLFLTEFCIMVYD